MVSDAGAGSLPRESLARSGALSLAGSVIAALAALALTAVVSHSYGPGGTGVFFQAVAIFTVLSQILKLGTNSALIRFISARRALTAASGIPESGAWRATIVATVPVIAIATITAIALVIWSHPLAELLAPAGDADRLADLLVTMAPFIVVGAVLGVLQTVARLVRGVGTFTVLQSILLPLSRLAVAFALVTAAFSADAAFVGWMIVLPAWLVVTVVVIAGPLLADRRAQQRVRRSTGWDEAMPHVSAREFWRFSAPRAVGAALETALDWSDVLVVAALTSPVDAGIYAVVTRAVRAGQIVDRAMRIAVSPRISHLLARAELEKATTLHTTVTRVLVLISWPIYLCLAILGPAVLALFGDGFRAGAPALAVLAVALMISSASGMLQSVLLQGGRSSWQMYNKGAVLAVNIGLSLLLVPVIGITGAALSWLACLLLDTALAAWQVHRILGVRLEPGALLLAAALPLVVYGIGGALLRVVAGTGIPVLLIGVPALSALYVALVFLARRRLGLAPGRVLRAPTEKQANGPREATATHSDR